MKTINPTCILFLTLIVILWSCSILPKEDEIVSLVRDSIEESTHGEMKILGLKEHSIRRVQSSQLQEFSECIKFDFAHYTGVDFKPIAGVPDISVRLYKDKKNIGNLSISTGALTIKFIPSEIDLVEENLQAKVGVLTKKSATEISEWANSYFTKSAEGME